MPYDLPSEAVEDAATETDERVWTCEDHQFRFPAPTVIHEVAETAAKIEEEIAGASLSTDRRAGKSAREAAGRVQDSQPSCGVGRHGSGSGKFISAAEVEIHGFGAASSLETHGRDAAAGASKRYV